MKKTVLFDIDGTLADISHRRHHVENGNSNWGRFNALMGEDVPNLSVVELYKTLWNTQKYELILVTGRSEDFRKITEQWLIWNEIPFGQLLMRVKNDYRKDVDIKRDILNTLLARGAEIEFCVDDRQQVVDMWRANGIVCLQCDVGDF